MERPSIFLRLGGEPAIMASVEAFYARLVADPLLSPMFEGLDPEQLTRKQVAFLARAFDGPREYHGRPLREAHRRLVEEHGLGDEHFDRVKNHLDAALEELGVEKDLRDEVADVVEATRAAVLGRETQGAITPV